MSDAIIVIIVIVVIFLLINNASRKAKRRALQRIRDNFGKPKNEYFNFDKIALYTNRQPENAFQKLSGQTVADIDVQSVFEYIDRTSSRVGQQYFYNKFCSPTNDTAALQDFDRQAEYFQTETEKREQVQLLLQKLSGNDAYTIAELLNEDVPKRPSRLPLLYINLFVLLLLLLLSVKFHVLLLWAFIPASINIFIGIWNKAHTASYSRSLPQVNILIAAAENLRRQYPPRNDEEVTQSLKALQPFRKKMHFVVFERDNAVDELTKAFLFIFEIIRSIFAVEVFVFNALLEDVFLRQKAIDILFKYIGETDASIAVADLRHGLNVFCKPDFLKDGKELRIEKMYHPLIKNCTANDLHLSGKSVLITGSNMSGKTTFLRTTALNVLSAQTIYTCFAQEFQLPVLRIFSSVRIDDDLLQGKSYYLEEVNVIKSLVNAADGNAPCLFVLDEVFKGTNTIERVALGKAVLNYLNCKNNIVFVATHDLELADMLSTDYELYYFTETVARDGIQFDHRIKRGKLNTANAVRLVEVAGFPSSIIEEAKALKQRLQKG